MKKNHSNIIHRKCSICLKKMKNKLEKDDKYDNGHYFGRVKFPVGKGEYKKIKSTKTRQKEFPVAKWTGKKKEFEYWECNKCFEEASHELWLEEKIEKLFGKGCKDYEPGCAVCQAWFLYETILEDNRGKL